MTNKNKKPQKQGPALIAFSVKDGKNGGNAYWTRIGAAWAHDDGEGFNLQLDLYPPDGKIVLRSPKSDDEAGA
jgi:hypothetical protein